MNDRVTCEAVMAAFVDTEQLGNQQLFDEVAKQMGIPDEVRHASAPVGRAGKPSRRRPASESCWRFRRSSVARCGGTLKMSLVPWARKSRWRSPHRHTR